MRESVRSHAGCSALFGGPIRRRRDRVLQHPRRVCTSRRRDSREDVTVVSEIPLSLPDEQAYLASALQLLIDAAFVRDGTRIGFTDIRNFLGDQSLSRSRWAYMLRGDSHRVTSEPILRSLAEFFHVDSVHLTSAGRSELLEMLADDLPAILRYRFLKVRRLAAGETLGVDDRRVDEISPWRKVLSCAGDGHLRLELSAADLHGMVFEHDRRVA